MLGKLFKTITGLFGSLSALIPLLFSKKPTKKQERNA